VEDVAVVPRGRQRVLELDHDVDGRLVLEMSADVLVVGLDWNVEPGEDVGGSDA
jgi:hypothetical protein